MDPVFSLILRAALSLLFATAALHKARDRGAFESVLRNYRVVPEVITPPLTLGIIASECGLALALWLPATAAAASLGAAALLTLYSLAIGANLARGRRDIDCGCLGPARKQTISGWLLARNALFVAGALLAALPQSARALGWVDGLSAAASLGLIVLLFAAVGEVAAQQPTSQRLRGSL